MVAGEVSSWRPPWFDTTIPAAPASAARRASSGRTIPLTSTGSRVIDRSQATSFQVSDGSRKEAT